MEMAMKRKATPEYLAEVLRGNGDAPEPRTARQRRAVVERARRAEARRKRELARIAPMLEPKFPSPRKKRTPKSGWRMLWERMEPGAWYCMADMVDLVPEFSPASVWAWCYQKLPNIGLTERTANPDHLPGSKLRGRGRYLFRRVEASNPRVQAILDGEASGIRAAPGRGFMGDYWRVHGEGKYRRQREARRSAAAGEG